MNFFLIKQIQLPMVSAQIFPGKLWELFGKEENIFLKIMFNLFK